MGVRKGVVLTGFVVKLFIMNSLHYNLDILQDFGSKFWPLWNYSLIAQ